MRLTVCLFLGLLLRLSQQFETIDCLYVAHVTLENSGVMTAGNQYSFPMTWTSALSDVSQSALALRGYQIQKQDCYLSYQASLSSAAILGGTIVLTPIQANTEIVSMQFEVLLVSSCGSGKLELLTERLAPSILSQTSRATISEQVFLVNSSSFNLTDSTDFYISVFLVDFQASRASDKTQQVRVTNITVSGQDIAVTLYSLHTYANSITSVTISLLLVKKSAFTPSIVYFNADFDSYCHECEKTFSMDPTTINADSCVMPLDQFRASSPAFTPKGVISRFDSSNIFYNTYALSWAVFNISCYLQCGDGSYYQYVNNISTCQSCPSDCVTCLNSTYCLSCNAASFLSSDQCVSCSPGCLNCTGLTACSLCEDIYALSSGQCSDCNSTTGFYYSDSKCYSCHPSCASCYGVSNNCSSCAMTYTLDTDTNTCLPAPNQIIDCFYITHTTLQLSGSNMTVPNTYSYSISWASPIDSIESAVLALGGFQIGPSFGYLSYHSQLTNLSSSGATIIITPNKTSSNIVLLQYDVLVTTNCASGKINIFSPQYFPTVLSDSSRSSDSEHVTIVSPVFDLTQSSNYFISVYLQDFVMFVPGNNYQRIGVDASSVQVYNGDIRFVLYSHVDYSNTITSVTFTIVIVRKNSYSHPIFEYNKFYDANCAGTGCTYTVPLSSSSLNPSQISTSNCLIAFYNLRTDYINETIRKVYITLNDFSVGYQVEKISWAEFNISCFLTCETGYYYDSNHSMGVCRMCPLECPICVNTTACCQTGYVYVSSSSSCSTCNSNQYISGNTCVTCATGCSSCANQFSCQSCYGGYELVSDSCQQIASAEESSSVVTIIVVAVVMVLLLTATVIFLIWLFATQGGLACRQRLCPQEPAKDSPAKDGIKQTLYAGKQPTIQDILTHDECPVCLRQQLDCKSACGHHFHMQCIREWAAKLMSCPVCRHKQLGPVDIYCKNCKRYVQTVQINTKDEQMNRCQCLEASSVGVYSHKKLYDKAAE